MANEQAMEVDRKWLALSLAQQGLWLDAKLSSASVYQLGRWLRIAAPIDESAVRQSIRLVMARHDALRLRVDDELPRQWLDESGETPFSVTDLAKSDNPDRAFADHVENIFASPMPLGDQPLFRVELVRAHSNLCYVLWRFHHLIADSASVAIALGHWFTAYDALTSADPPELAPPSSYLKTIAADAAYLQSAAHHQDLAYWSSRFEPLPPPLISDMDARESGTRKVPIVDFTLAGEVLARFENAASAAGATASRALFALFTLTLGKRYGQSDVVAGVALHRRDLSNRNALGTMAGVIPVRFDFDPASTIAECIGAFGKQLDADLRHQRLPVDVLSRALGLSGTGRAGLFEAVMSYIPAERGQNAIGLDGLPVTMSVVDTKEASPISLHATELPGGCGLEVRLAVNTDFLDAAQAATLSELLRSAIDRFVESPQTRFDDLDSISPAERRSVVEDWNSTESHFAPGTLDDCFVAQARRTPDAVAVVGLDGTEFSYAQLHERSDRLARQLVAAGVAPEKVVGVSMERSAETVIALLAILKAGGVYLPLDRAYPAERLDYIAKDAGAMLVLDSIDSLHAEAELPVLTDPNRLAYVIYTSGTTGKPKGVAMEHRAALNLAFARDACHDPLGVSDRVLAAISVGFDVSIGQLLLPLLSGATVVIAPDVKTLGAAEFWAFLARRQVSHINSVPSFFESILDAAPPAGSLKLKRLMLGGEALSGALVGRIQEAVPGVEIVNMYGPTEACIDATYHVATAADLKSAVLPIGKPLSNYRAYVLDGQLQPTGVGVSGELYLGGSGLARGYVNAEKLTAERFISDPFNSGGRLYKTGDRARWRADGRIEFLGRVDQQVKIRGFRVEPAEIEQQLLLHPDVVHAVVVPRMSKPGGPARLIAYFVPRSPDAVPETSVLRSHLAQLLPDYMVPSGFVPIAEMPLNQNGKLDSAALPSPDLVDGEYVAPRTPTEESIAALFAEVLGLDQCGATDHFFELGGHSLLATSLISKMSRQGMSLPLRAIFETPTVEMLARQVDVSLPAPVVAQTIQIQERPRRIPLSFPQERIWFVDRLQGDSSYNIPIAFEIHGPLDLTAARRAMETVVRRHDALRTRIVLRDGLPAQEIDELKSFDFAVNDLSALGAQESEDARQAVLTALVDHHFDLASELPFQMRLVAFAPDRHLLAAVIHHVAFDGWSAGILLREFGELYSAIIAGTADPLPSLPIQYADFSIWQRQQNRALDLAYWIEELNGAPAVLELPSLDAPPRPGPCSATTLPISLGPSIHAALQKLAQESGASLFMVLHAAFALLLSRLSGQDDVVIGTVTANRNHSELEPIIGCFVNTLPLRTRFVADESFRQFLARVKSADLAAYAHQDLPFEQLVEAVHVERSLQHTPIFQVMLVLQNTPIVPVRLPGLVLEPIPVDARVAKFDLTLNLTEGTEGLRGTFEFANERFALGTIDRLAKQFERLLRSVTADPDQRASCIDLLEASERACVLSTWNQTERSFELGTLDGLFSAQAERTPDAIAVIGVEGAELSYGELDARSTKLARQLVAAGVGRDGVVGVRMKRSSETIIALLAILKSGGVYLPLDPAYPAERLSYIAQDAGAMRVLESIEGLSGEADLPLLGDPDRLAYVIYTSGTSGKPKGVMVAHAAAVNLAFARRACHDPLNVGDRVLAAISVGFDVSIGQLLLPLLSGATVVIAPDVKTMGAGALWALLAERRITHINSVPSFLDSILDAAPTPGTLSLKRLMLGGEALSGALVGRIQQAIPGVEVVNMYGPTEACIDATYHVATEEDLAFAVLPIGRPLSNYKAYVLDAHLQPTGIGISGELYLGGMGLARGYVNAQQLTAERFIPDPFGSKGRLYKTGDRARWRDDGRLEFLGRLDEQVKIRGFRVEPGEIEQQLRSQPGVREAAVIAMGSNGTTRLIAYTTGDSSPEALRAGLARTLPDYMVPSAFVKLEQLPLSANGKLDRKALPAPDQHDLISRPFEAPVGPVEEQMAALWAQLLKIHKVGRHDNFFELGGHSLLAVSLIERMQQQGLPGDVRGLFTTPTIAGLAGTNLAVDALVPENRILPGTKKITPEMLPLVKLAQAQLTQAQIDRLIESVPGGVANVQDIYPLSPLQEGILFQHLITARGDAYLSPFLLGFDSRDRLDAFVSALRQLVKRHDVLRTAMAWKHLESPVQVVWREAPLAVEEVTLDQSALMERFNPQSYRLDLSQAPLMRVVITRDQSGERDRWLLLLLTHHLVLDHTSLEILVGELSALVVDPQAVLPVPLPYRNFIAQTLSGVTREEHEAFFGQMLGDVEEPTAPYGLLDVQGDIDQTTEGRLTIRGELDQRLRDKARSMGVTPASLFHLAWGAVLGAVSSRTDVVFGTVLFGRMRSGAGADRVVGMFINTLPIRLTLDTTGVADSVMRTHQLLAELMVHEHAPLSLAQRASGVPAPAPLFSSLFNYRYSAEPGQGASGQGASGQGASGGIEVMQATERTNYPLSMAVDDSGSSFLLSALAQPGADANQVCAYLQQSLTGLLDLLDRTPDEAIQTLSVLPAQERQLVVNEWNQTEASFPSGTLDGLFSAQAERTPDAIAVIGVEGAELSYGELDARSTKLARQLVAAGVGRDGVVGVRMKRSSETIIALLAILKSGGVYLPLDPAYPAERLSYIAQDAGAMRVLESIEGLSGEADLPLLGDPDRLAYVIYTSGTSGKPKGVMVAHAAAVNLAFARRACHDPLNVGDRVLAAISVGFDVSIGQLLLPLLSGATVVIAPDVKTMGAGALWALLAERRITHINSVPSFLDSILDAAPTPGTLSLKRLMLGGEALSGALVGRIQQAIPGVEVVNMYGPTEACIDATYHVATEEDLAFAVLPIGRPLSNYKAYVLDAHLQPTGIGISGELYLGGMGLARGYVNAQQLTAERFIPDPFGSKGRLYKTGDRARWRDDGRLEFLGRLDEQVKIRGFRVEPGEIEQQLRSQPGVREAAVIAMGSNGTTRLIAYTTGDSSPEALRAGLARTLPDYMVPSAFVKLEQLPLSANGKLDRKALPAPDQHDLISRPFEAPVGPVEEQMAALWAQLLKIHKVGRHDNFFELGGHSLLAVSLIERMQQQGLPGDVRGLFTTPTIAGLAGTNLAVDALVPENRILPGTKKITPEMLPLVKLAQAQLTQAQIDRLIESVPGGVANVQDIYPLSPLQEGILFQHLITARGDAYLSPFLLGFDSRDRLDAFVSALRQLVKRHDVLRTAMAWKHLESPVQVVWREAPLAVEEVTLDQSALMERFNPQSYRLDLSQAPLMRVVITRDQSGERDRWLLLLLTHHLVLDHTSLEILVGELSALVVDPQAVLPVPLPYRNFIAQTLSGVTREEHEAFFGQMLGDVEEPTAPYGLLDVQGDIDQTTEGRLTIRGELDQRLRDKARSMGVTPASLFHLAWGAVLGAVSSRTDVVFGTVLFGRMRSGAGADRVVGMFINTLPIRLTLDTTGVADSVMRTHQLLAELMVHEHAPLSLAQRASGVPAPAPLFSSLFNYRYSAEPGQGASGQGASGGIEVMQATERTNYPLSMAVDDSGSSFLLSALAQPGADANQVCAYLQQSLTGLLDLLDRTPDEAIQTLSVLPAQERQLVVNEWNQTEASFPSGTLDGLFSAQAERTPDAIAVIGVEGAELSYGELDARSTKLARQLVAAGVGRDGVVGVRMKRSSETIIALLAILKSGGVYLPLDPAYPAERLSYIAQDAGAMRVLESIEGLSGEADLPLLGDPDRLAYVIYTSGTSGKPKGVMVAHAAAVNLAFARRACHDPLNVGDRVLAAISVGFDVSIGQLLLPLLSGATVVIAPDVKTMGAGALWALLAERRITHINSVPSFLDSILDAAPTPGTLSLKRLMLGGEALSGALVGRIQQAIPGVEVVNMYGPTEACIDATYHVATEEDLAFAVLPIGRPLSNYKAYVLDAHLQPTGIGISGELYLGGMGLARGYVNAQQLTAERFIPDPFGSKGRLYKTGDRARWRDDGRLEFLGRLDEQVKIRGFRVEPGEIEQQLRSQPGVREAAVIAMGSNGTTRLIAYTTGDSSPEALRAGLARTLPDYMVPSAFVKLEQLPLSANGKLDRKALPAPDQHDLISRPFEAPVGPVEEQMAALWAQLLKIHKVGRHDNFFELGGDSLSAMRLISSLNIEFNADLPIRCLFAQPTVKALAEMIADGSTVRRSNNLVPLQPNGKKPKLFCIHPAGGHVFCYLPLIAALDSDQPVFALVASGLERGETMPSTIEEMATTYIQAIQTVEPAGPYHLLGMSSGGLIALEMAQQLNELGKEVRMLALLDTTVPGSISETIFSEEYLLRAIAEEIGSGDLLDGAGAPKTLAELVDRAHEAHRLPPEFDLAQAERVADVFRNTVRMHAAYRPRVWEGPMLLVRALRRAREIDTAPNWSPYVGSGLAVVDIDCTHSGLVSAAIAPKIAELVSRMDPSLSRSSR